MSKIKYCVTVCYNKTVEVEVQDPDNQMEVNLRVNRKVDNMLEFMRRDGWTEDEFDITQEEDER